MKVLVLGAGKIGGAIVDLLNEAGEEVTVADQDRRFLGLVPTGGPGGSSPTSRTRRRSAPCSTATTP